MLSEEEKKIYINHLNESIHYCNESLLDYSGKKLEINCVITDSMEFNANCSLLPEGFYKLNIRSEVFEKTFRILNTLLYEKNINFYTIVSGGDQKYDLKKANLYLDLMHSISYRLIIYHELGHIFNGHLDYYHSRSISPRNLSLFMDSRKNQLPSLESQVLEMDADAFAATRLIGQFTYNPNINSINKAAPALLKSQIHAFLLVIISSCITFSIMGLGYKRDQVNYLESKYLPLRTRQDYYVRCALNAYKMFNNGHLDTDPELLDITFYREVLYNVEQYVNLYYREALGFQKIEIDSSNNRNEMDTVLIKHSDFLDTFWRNEMRNKLSPFSYFYLAE
ncbi:hypothetical protein [Paenibacillus kribbensis]|uniref:hypothetical protein n=1 Tax=Paenibacillus kribbensis TaxID=172713 RepID=UPI000837B2AD|nr:hypothetical protein [Paenibacillus kribbensis]